MKISVYFLLVFAIAEGAIAQSNEKNATTTPYFRPGYTYFEEFHAFYKFHMTRRGFSDAISTCTGEGATLFRPLSANESDAMIKKLVLPLSDQIWGFWLGIHDLYSEGEFVTVDGLPLEKTFSNWGPGQPDNQPDNVANCVVMYTRDATFNDGTCDFAEHFICKKEADAVKVNTNCETTDQAYKYNVLLDKCYKVHTQPKTWRDAFKTCRAEEANLVVINGEAEAKYLVTEMAQHPADYYTGMYNRDNFHVGFNDVINHGSYVTIDGKPLAESGYRKWAAGQPDNRNGNEHCGAVFREGLLNDIDCATKAMFVCEKAVEGNSAADNNFEAGPPAVEPSAGSASPSNPNPVKPSTVVPTMKVNRTTDVDEEVGLSEFTKPGAVVLLPDADDDDFVVGQEKV